MRQPITNFTKGELSPELYGRIDNPQYTAAAKQISNFIIHKTGGLFFRPGFRFVGEADDVDTPIRYVPFQYSIEAGAQYILTFMDADMRALALGGFVLEDNVKITAITKAVNAQLTVPFHAYTAGTRIYIAGVSGMVEINGRFATVLTVPDPNTITVDIDSRDFSTFTSSDGTLRASPPPPPPPVPPPPPAPTPDPPPPPVGGGGGGGGGRYDDAPI